MLEKTKQWLTGRKTAKEVTTEEVVTLTEFENELTQAETQVTTLAQENVKKDEEIVNLKKQNEEIAILKKQNDDLALSIKEHQDKLIAGGSQVNAEQLAKKTTDYKNVLKGLL